MGAPEPTEPEVPLVERLRDLHLRMVDAVLGGDGVAEVARLTAQMTGAPVAIVLPRLGAAAIAPLDDRRRPRRAAPLRFRPHQGPPVRAPCVR